MFAHQLLANFGWIAKILLTFSVPLVLLALRSLLRRREEHLLVRLPANISTKQHLDQWAGDDHFFPAQMSASTSVAREMASLIRPTCKMHQSGQC